MAPVGQCKIFVKNRIGCHHIPFRNKNNAQRFGVSFTAKYKWYFERNFILPELMQCRLAAPVSSVFYSNRVISVLDTQNTHEED